MPTVNHDILVWARETAGLTPESAVKKLGIRATKGMSALDRLAALESGHLQPTRPMLTKMAQHYRRPLVAFYMSQQPLAGEKVEDFRSIPDRDVHFDALITALVRDVKGRQAALRDFLSDEEEAPRLDFVGSVEMVDGVDAVLEAMQNALKISLSDFRSQPTPEQAFGLLRTRAESVGVFVLLMGDLGSHHTSIDPEAFRGVTLADPFAPFVVVNDQDARTAWSFTLLHELTHLWLGTSGISGKISDTRIEKFCNDVASRFLLPTSELKEVKVTDRTEFSEAANTISDFARSRHLSSSMVAYCLSRAGLISIDMWRRLSRFFFLQWRANKKSQKEKRRDDGGPSYYTVRRHRLGRALLEVVSRGMSEGALTPTKAGQVLGVKPRSVAPLLSGTTMSSGRAA